MKMKHCVLACVMLAGLLGGCSYSKHAPAAARPVVRAPGDVSEHLIGITPGFESKWVGPPRVLRLIEGTWEPQEPGEGDGMWGGQATEVRVVPGGVLMDRTLFIRMPDGEKAKVMTSGRELGVFFGWFEPNQPPDELPKGDDISWIAGEDPFDNDPDTIRPPIFENAQFTVSLGFRRCQGKPRGVVVLLNGAGGGTELQSLRDQLADRGYGLLSWSTVSINNKNSEWAPTDSDGSEDDFTSEKLFGLMDHSSAQLLSGYASAFNAAYDKLIEDEPDYAGLPVVVVGFSMGAIVGPTVAAHLGEPVKACVFVGGGTDMTEIMTRGRYFKGMKSFQEIRRLPEREFEPLAKGFLEKRCLDPYHTAPQIAHLPILTVLARNDRIVPTRNGMELWRRLGEQELWLQRGGHVNLYLAFPRHAEEIVEWIEEAIEP